MSQSGDSASVCPSIRISTSPGISTASSVYTTSSPATLSRHVPQASSLHPLICIQPATPTTPSTSSISVSPSSTTQPHSHSPWGPARSISPAPVYGIVSNSTGSTPSHSQLNVSTSSTPTSNLRRPLRFSMGPRADCEKCRMGVKGHSVHLD
jgi:hypothetical protein